MLLKLIVSLFVVYILYVVQGSGDSAVGRAAGYGMDDRGVGRGAPRRSERFWGPPSLLSNGYWGLFPRGKVAGP
jgi:hypothetical protein